MTAPTAQHSSRRDAKRVYYDPNFLDGLVALGCATRLSGSCAMVAAPLFFVAFVDVAVDTELGKTPERFVLDPVVPLPPLFAAGTMLLGFSDMAMLPLPNKLEACPFLLGACFAIEYLPDLVLTPPVIGGSSSGLSYEGESWLFKLSACAGWEELKKSVQCQSLSVLPHSFQHRWMESVPSRTCSVWTAAGACLLSSRPLPGVAA